MKRPPQISDDNAWINWSILAVNGNLAEADALMRAYGNGVQRFAVELMRARPVEWQHPLYRGMLLSGSEVDAGVLPKHHGVESVSFTADKEVACWFADPHATVGEFVASQGKRRGYVAEYAPASASEILLHHAWVTDDPLVPLAGCARVHPLVRDLEQFTWYLATQKEVITLPPARLEVRAVEDFAECGDEVERALRDARLTPPRFRSRAQDAMLREYADEMAAAAMEMSDEEVFESVRAGGEDPEEVARRMRARMLKAARGRSE